MFKPDMNGGSAGPKRQGAGSTAVIYTAEQKGPLDSPEKHKRLLSPGALYWQRVRDHYRFQYKALTSVVDLTILLYIVIPGLLFAGRVYYGLWTETVPDMLLQLPLASLTSLWLLFTTLRGLMLRLESADILFLISRRSWIGGLMRRGIAESIGYSAGLTFIGGLLLSPLLVRFMDLAPARVAVLGIVIFSFRIVHMLLLHFCRIKWTGWQSAMLQTFSHALVFVMLQLVVRGITHGGSLDFGLALGAALIMAAAGILLIVARMKQKGSFYADIEEELKQKLRLSAFLLSNAVDKPKRHRSKPWLFRRSNALTAGRGGPRTRLAELTVKSILRNGTALRMLLIYTGAGAVSLQFPPYPVNLLVFAGLILLQAYWLDGMRRVFLESRVMSVLPANEALVFQAAAPVMRMLLLVPVTLFSLSLGWAVVRTWWGAAAGFAIGLLLSWWLGSWLWKLFGGWRKKITLPVRR
ncbi:hypothetical protein AWM70_21950 [Paenibacillus yonginensis]|uniref:Uncharacterized protein n=1 Tax=Paenibacillus yonginensis TaxID=1462996 RepID=A0A1B1N699_9BACL|nr:ABC transporter permease [Paenibacillus yonginensis]ANS76915.1 hypothetical protein AWM70_21950 [Paenibacillus yonginensis]